MVCERRVRQLAVLSVKTDRLHYPALLFLEEVVESLLDHQRRLEAAGGYRNWDEARGLAPRTSPPQ
jgi:hypothetical protein